MNCFFLCLIVQKLLDGLKPHVIPRLEGKETHRILISTPLPESEIAEYLTQLEAKAKPHGVKVGSYPRWGLKRNTVTLVGKYVFTLNLNPVSRLLINVLFCFIGTRTILKALWRKQRRQFRASVSQKKTSSTRQRRNSSEEETSSVVYSIHLLLYTGNTKYTSCPTIREDINLLLPFPSTVSDRASRLFLAGFCRSELLRLVLVHNARTLSRKALLWCQFGLVNRQCLTQNPWHGKDVIDAY